MAELMTIAMGLVTTLILLLCGKQAKKAKKEKKEAEEKLEVQEHINQVYKEEKVKNETMLDSASCATSDGFNASVELMQKLHADGKSRSQ